jgi:hypothetical protein
MGSRRLLALGAALLLGFGPLARSRSLVAEVPSGSVPDTAWAYSTPLKPAVPRLANTSANANPIDAFILAKLQAKQLSLSPRADKLTLLRRVTFDLTGLPPTPAEQEAFLADNSAGAYERVVDRLLASPRYGERWAQHWLDLVRYAETDGFKADEYRPNAYRYRDYVIAAFNDDLPYNRFIQQQLAGDELEPENPQALIATGFNRLLPDESNAANLEQRRQETLDDVTDVTGQVFLGLTVGCARCHDHKFDPTSQTDYYRLQAFFAAMQSRDDVPLASPGDAAESRRERAAWERANADILHEMASLAAAKRADGRKNALSKFRKEIQDAVLTAESKRSPYQEQIALMAEKQLQRGEEGAPNKLSQDQKKRYKELERQLASRPPRPKALPVAMAVTDMGRQAPPTYVLDGGAWNKPRSEVQPGFPEFLPAASVNTECASECETTGRRAALARWLTQRDHPLTARVRVNRLWQHHFGRGIVATPSDFGAQGDPPTHAELLDWLAVDFVEHGWSEKYLHRLMVTSQTYCQSSEVDRHDPAQVRAAAIDPENKLLWHARRRRLEGEAIRDAVLFLAGDLNTRMQGPSCRPELPPKISNYAWKPDQEPVERNRRSIYILAKRNMRYPLFDAFDLPDMHNSCARRSQTTTAPQALLMLNGEFIQEQARSWSQKLEQSSSGDVGSQIAFAYRCAWGRPATEEEIRLALTYLRQPGVTLGDFCHALLNTNEFLYVD